MRKEIIGNCELYLGDSLEILPTVGKVDSLITDPVWPNCPLGLIQGSEDPWALFEKFCNLLPQDLRQLVIIMRNDSDPRFLKYIPERLRFQQICWLKYAMPSYLGRVLGGNETVYVFGEPVKSAPGRRCIPSCGPVMQPDARIRNGHPCPRPLVGAEWFTKCFSDEGETICDPFMGSGTTGVAAVKFDRKFIGIEIEEKYFDIACRRIESAKRAEQVDMVLE